MNVRIESITAEAFAPFGELLEAPASPPRQNFAASIVNLRATARANLALIHSIPFENAPVTRLERHPYSNQLFTPLDVDAYLLLVTDSAADDRPDPSKLRAFRVERHQAINYLPGTWHMNMATIGTAGLFAMLVHEDGSTEDCEFCDITAITIQGI